MTDTPISDYIRENRDRLTREAITQQLVAAGHDPAQIREAWDALAIAEPMAPSPGKNVATYVWIAYGLGAAVILVFTALGLGAFGVGWLLAFALAAAWPMRWLARKRPQSGAGVVGVVLAAVLLVVGIGGGICLATLAVFLSTYQF